MVGAALEEVPAGVRVGSRSSSAVSSTTGKCKARTAQKRTYIASAMLLQFLPPGNGKMGTMVAGCKLDTQTPISAQRSLASHAPRKRERRVHGRPGQAHARGDQRPGGRQRRHEG